MIWPVRNHITERWTIFGDHTACRGAVELEGQRLFVGAVYAFHQQIVRGVVRKLEIDNRVIDGGIQPHTTVVFLTIGEDSAGLIIADAIAVCITFLDREPSKECCLKDGGGYLTDAAAYPCNRLVAKNYQTRFIARFRTHIAQIFVKRK